jgi:hypothetical protein
VEVNALISDRQARLAKPLATFADETNHTCGGGATGESLRLGLYTFAKLPTEVITRPARAGSKRLGKLKKAKEKGKSVEENRLSTFAFFLFYFCL